MRRRAISLLTLLVAVSITAGVALAQSPHFLNNRSDATINSDCQLVVSWKEAGLGDNQLITYQASSTLASATYACINGGGKHPQAANKEVVSGPLSCQGVFESGKNGQISGSLACGPADPGSFSCPSGQDMILAACSYEGISLADTTNNVVASGLPDSLSRCNISGSLAAELCP
jgi:hypothetical protein